MPRRPAGGGGACCGLEQGRVFGLGMPVRTIPVFQFNVQIPGDDFILAGSDTVGEPGEGGADEQGDADEHRKDGGQQRALCVCFVSLLYSSCKFCRPFIWTAIHSGKAAEIGAHPFGRADPHPGFRPVRPIAFPGHSA